MKILCTGASGFVCSHLVDKLLGLNHIVIGIDNFLTSDNRFLPKHENFTFIKTDIVDLNSVNHLFNYYTFDYIFHLAADARAPSCSDDPYGTSKTNIAATLYLLEQSRRHNAKGFVFASSSAVYGIYPNLRPVKEDSKLAPISFYGAAKLTGDNMVKLYHQYHGLNTVSLRYFNVYGTKRQRVSSVFSSLVKCQKKKKTFEIYGDGSDRRDYIHVYDVVDATASILDKDDKWEGWGSAYNIGTGSTRSVLELVELFGTKDFKHVKARLEDTPLSWADPTLARKELGFSAKISVKEGIKILKKSHGLTSRRKNLHPRQPRLSPAKN